MSNPLFPIVRRLMGGTGEEYLLVDWGFESSPEPISIEDAKLLIERLQDALP